MTRTSQPGLIRLGEARRQTKASSLDGIYEVVPLYLWRPV